MCWVSAIYAIVIAIVGEVLRPKTKFDKGKPAGTGDIDFPTSEAGRVFPWLCGTVKVLGPNVVAFTGLRNEKSQKKVKTGWFSSTKQLLGYRYYATLQMVYCGFSGLPGSKLGGLVGYQINDKFLKMTQNQITDHVIYVQIDDKSFNGDAKTEGGYAGLIRIYRGTDDQPRDFFLPGALVDPNLSAYPCVCYAVFQDFYLGMSLTSLPPIIPVLSAFHNSLGVPSGHEKINATANNVICAMYELLIDPYRGMGISPNLIDRPAFLAAAEVCFNEQIGVNVLIDSATTGRSALDDLQRYCDGQVFEDPFTGLWTITLARADYDIDSPNLIELNDDNSVVVDATKTSWADTRNTFSIKYTDKDSNWTAQSVQSQDMGNLVARDGQISAADLDYTAVDNAGLANFLAERARVGLATPLKQLTIEAQGTGSLLRINDVFRGKFPSKRIEKMALRVTDIEYPVSDDGITTITAIEDKFGVAYVAYTAVPDTSWTPPDYSATPALRQMAQEVPFALTPDLSTNRFIMTAATRSGSLEVAYDVLNTTAATLTNEDLDLTPSGTLVATLGIAGPVRGETRDDALAVAGVIDPQEVGSATPETYLIGDSMVLVDNELIAFQNFELDTATGHYLLWPWRRAVYDTIPATHAVGAAVFFMSAGAGLAQELPYAGDGPVTLKLLPKTQTEDIDPALVTPITVDVQQRAARPYLPANVLLNGVPLQSYLASTDVAGTFGLGWATRNRVTQRQYVVAYDDPDVTPPDDVQYALQFYDATGTLLVEKLDIAGAGAVVVLNYTGAVHMVFWSRNATLDSFYKYDSHFDYTKDPMTTESTINAGTWTPSQTIIDGGEVVP